MTETRTTAFPARPQFSGFMKPCRVEGETLNLEVLGDLPTDIDGVFYRVMPDPQLPPFIENDPVSEVIQHSSPARVRTSKPMTIQWFNGDGNITAFRFHDGRVSFQQRYVRTEKFVRERQAQRALIGW